MLGNFITHFWGRLPYEKRRMADDVWQKLFRGKSVVNLGYGWDRIENVQWRGLGDVYKRQENVQWRVLHGELLFRFFSQEPVGDTFHIDSRTEELVNMLLVVIVLSSDAADGDTVAFGGGIEP